MTATADRSETTSPDTDPDHQPPTDPSKPASATSATPRKLLVVLLSAAIALVIVGVVFLIRSGSDGDSSSSRNDALVDRADTTEVIGQVSTALNQVLSYDYRKPQAAQAAAKRYLTGDAPAQYQLLLSQVQKASAGQQLTLVAKVSAAGVTSLRGDRAQLLVFLDQQSTRASDGQSSTAAAQVQIGAVKHGNEWQISELKPL